MQAVDGCSASLGMESWHMLLSVALVEDVMTSCSKAGGTAQGSNLLKHWDHWVLVSTHAQLPGLR